MNTARLLTPPTNYAVVQLPGRAFPGVVFQGDSLHAMVTTIKAVSEQVQGADEDADMALSDLVELLAQVSSSYEATCQAHGIPLPYAKNSPQ